MDVWVKFNETSLLNKKTFYNQNLVLKEQLICNKYQSKVSIERTNQYLDNLNDTSSQGLNRLFVLSFEDNAHQPSYKRLQCYD